MRGPLGGGLAGQASAPEFPATLAGLALWLDARLPGFTASSALATVPFGRVARIAQPKPLTGDWTASGANCPWRETAALDFHYFNPTTLTPPAYPPLPARDCTIACAFQTRLGQGLSSPFGFNAGGGSFGFYTSGATLVLASPAGLVPVAGIPNPWLEPGNLIAKVTLIVACRASSYELWITVDGVPFHTVIAQVPSSGNLGPLLLGSYAGVFTSNTHAAVSEFVAYNVAHSPADCLELQDWLLAHLPGDPPVQAALVAGLGDSIQAAWPPVLQPTFDNTPTPVRWVNAAVAGAHNTDGYIPAFFQSDLMPLYSPLRAKNVLICEGISVNDVALLLTEVPAKTPEEAAQIIVDDYFATCDTAKAAGWIVIVMDLLPTTTTIPGFDACRALINTRIRAEWAAHGAVFYDIGATPGMSTRADAGNTALFYDGTHPTQAGYLVLDTTLQPALAAALNL